VLWLDLLFYEHILYTDLLQETTFFFLLEIFFTFQMGNRELYRYLSSVGKLVKCMQTGIYIVQNKAKHVSFTHLAFKYKHEPLVFFF